MKSKEKLTQMIWNITGEEEEPFFSFLDSNGYAYSLYKEPEWPFFQLFVYAIDSHHKEIQRNIEEWIQEGEKEGYMAKDFPRNYHEISLEEADWLDYWKKFFKPIPIGKKLEILPSWISASGERISLLLEPKMGFGTGQHESTYLCLLALEREDLTGKKILDIGAGSGILGVASLLLGASKALLLEKDRMAIESCEDTILRNHVQEKAILVNEDIFDFSGGSRDTYDLAFINIIAEVIIDILQLPWLLSIPVLFLSGILKEKKSMVLRALKIQGWQVFREEEKGAWVFLEARRVLSHSAV